MYENRDEVDSEQYEADCSNNGKNHSYADFHLLMAFSED